MPDPVLLGQILLVKDLQSSGAKHYWSAEAKAQSAHFLKILNSNTSCCLRAAPTFCTEG